MVSLYRHMISLVLISISTLYLRPDINMNLKIPQWELTWKAIFCCF